MFFFLFFFVLEILHNVFGQKLGCFFLSEIISLENRILCRGENMNMRPILITHVDTFDNHAHQDPEFFLKITAPYYTIYILVSWKMTT